MKPDALFVTFDLDTKDPQQADLSTRLLRLIENVPQRTAISGEDRPGEGQGKSLMKAGQGALSLEHVSSQLYLRGYRLVKAYRDGETKITFVATTDPNASAATDATLDRLISDLTNGVGYQVIKWNNPNGTIAYSAKCPVNLAKKAAKAAAKGREFTITYVIFDETE